MCEREKKKAFFICETDYLLGVGVRIVFFFLETKDIFFFLDVINFCYHSSPSPNDLFIPNTHNTQRQSHTLNFPDFQSFLFSFFVWKLSWFRVGNLIRCPLGWRNASVQHCLWVKLCVIAGLRVTLDIQYMEVLRLDSVDAETKTRYGHISKR